MPRNPAPAPSPASTARRVDRGVTATSRDGEGRGEYTNERHVTNQRGECTKRTKRTKRHTPHHSTCHHVCEPLLAGGVTGATDTTRAERTETNATRATTKQTQRRPNERKQTQRRPNERKQTQRRPNERKQTQRRPNERKWNGTPHPCPQPPSHYMRGGYFFVSSSLSTLKHDAHAHPPSRKTRGRVSSLIVVGTSIMKYIYLITVHFT